MSHKVQMQSGGVCYSSSLKIDVQIMTGLGGLGLSAGEADITALLAKLPTGLLDDKPRPHPAQTQELHVYMR